MKLLELKEDTFYEGLLITDESGPPRINISTDWNSFLPLDENLATVFRRIPKVAPIRQRLATLANDHSVLCAPRKNDHLALVRIEVSGGTGGLVHLTSTQRAIGVFDERTYQPFPSQGVCILGDMDEGPPRPIPPADKLEALAIMQPGASFRIFRTGQLHELPTVTSFLWDGRRMKRISQFERDVFTAQEEKREKQQKRLIKTDAVEAPAMN